MSPLILQGIEISITGLVITFSALGVFILVMMLLKFIFRNASTNGDSPEMEATLDETKVPGTLAEETASDSELVAVITAAVTYFRTRSQSSLGTTLETGKGTWWVSNRLNAKQGTVMTIKRSG